MLNPDNRQLYLQALKPPLNYKLEYGIGTTYTLDLTTLLIVPLALVNFSAGEDKDIFNDRIAVTEALQRAANKLTVFSQQGRITIPKNINLLYSYLEDIVIEVQPAGGKGVFHPKIWVLKFLNNEGQVRYRLVILSRNITFDKSWDSILVLEGETSATIIDKNKPLSDFISYLPRIAVANLNEAHKEKIVNLADEIMNVKFQAPEDFEDDLQFYPLGIEGYNGFIYPDNYEQSLMISPFISSNLLNRFKGNKNILISRDDQIQEVYDTIKDKFTNIYVMDSLIESIGSDIDIDAEKNNYQIDTEVRSGLHTKLFLFEKGNEASLWVGSANATNAAYNNNIEFMVRLQGRKNKIGIDNFLGDKIDENSFASLLMDYRHWESNQPDEIEIFTQRLEEIRELILGLKLELQVLKEYEEDVYTLKIIAAKKINIDNNIIYGFCWPITRKEAVYKVRIDKLFTEGEILFRSLSLETLTSFLAFSLKIKTDDHH